MFTNLHSTAKRAISHSGVALLVVVSPFSLSSQIVDATDPCYQTLQEAGSLQLLTKLTLSDPSRLGGALYEIDAWKSGALLSVSTRGDQIAAGTALTDAERAQWRRIRDCIDWLRDVAKRVNESMEGAGINIVEPSGSQKMARGKAVPRDAFVAAMLKEFGTLHANIGTLLKPK